MSEDKKETKNIQVTNLTLRSSTTIDAESVEILTGTAETDEDSKSNRGPSGRLVVAVGANRVVWPFKNFFEVLNLLL